MNYRQFSSAMTVLQTGYDVLDRLRSLVQARCRSRVTQTAIGLLLLAFAFGVNAVKPFVKGISTGAVLVPILILGFALIYRENSGWIRTVVMILGKYSMNIWFLHCALFSVYTCDALQPIAYLPRIPVLVVAWILMICLAISIPLTKVQKKTLEKVSL